MKIAIIGTGGVGGYFGAKLAQHGNDVTFIARGKHLEAIRDKGLLVKSFLGDFKIDNVSISDRISDLKSPEFVLICTKAWQVKEVCEELKNVIGENTVVIPLQNGVLAAEEIADILGKKHVINGLCKIISMIEAPGIIIHQGVEPTIVIGELNNKKTERIERIQTTLVNAEINTIVPPDIEAELWKKFISICISGLLAVCNSSYGEVRELPETRTMMVELFNEIFRIAMAKGVKLRDDYVSKLVTFIDSLPYGSNSSLTRDVLEGKPSEIEYQNGTVVRLGKNFKMSTPINSFVYNCILPMEKRTRSIQK